MAAGFDEVEHGDDEHAGVERHRFAGFQIDADAVALAEALNGAAQAINVVTRASDVVAAAEVEPFQAGDEVAEFRFECVGGVFERVGVLLAECVEV